MLRLRGLYPPVRIRQFYSAALVIGQELNPAPLSSFRVAGETYPRPLRTRADLHAGPSILVNQPQQNCLSIFLVVLRVGGKNGDLRPAFSVLVHDDQLAATKHWENLALLLCG